MPKTDPLDRPVTLRELKDAFDSERASRVNNTFAKVVAKLVADASVTDFVKVRFGSAARRYVYRVSEQPARRVQVGDLVTVGPNGFSSQPQVGRVAEINVPAPTESQAVCVAISPEDAARIEAALGSVR